MANPRVRRTSGFHFLTTSVENSCPWMSGSFMLSHKVIHLSEIRFEIKMKNKEKDRILGFKDASMAILIWRHDFYDVRKFVTSIENAHLHLFVNLLDQTHSFAIKLDNFTLLSYICVNMACYCLRIYVKTIGKQSFHKCHYHVSKETTTLETHGRES